MSPQIMFETRQLIHLICYLTMAKQYQADSKTTEVEHKMLANPSDDFFRGCFTSNAITKQTLNDLKVLKKSLIRLELIQSKWNINSIEKLLHLHFEEEYKLDINACVGLNYHILCTLLGQDETSTNHVLHSIFGMYGNQHPSENKLVGSKGRPKIPVNVKHMIEEIQKDKAKRKMSLIYQQNSLISALKPAEIDTIIHALQSYSGDTRAVNELISKVQTIKQHLEIMSR